MLTMIDDALDQMKDRSYVTHREFSDILLDMRLALMKEREIDGIISFEDDGFAGDDNLSTSRLALSSADR